MNYLIPIDKNTGEISPLSLLNIFLANKGTLELYPTHQKGFDYNEKKGLVNNEATIDYSFDKYRLYVQLPNIDKIKPYTNLFYNIEKNVWIYEESIDIAKAKKLVELSTYDSSTDVNSFSIHGVAMWLGKEQRLSIANLAHARKAVGETTMELNLNGQFITLPIEMIIGILNAVEIYAGDCYNVTQKHSLAIDALTTIAEVEQYNFKTGYPEKLSF